MQILKRWSLAAIFLSSITSLRADPTGPVFPPPGGVVTANSGTPSGSTTGRTLFYTGFNPASYTELDWTFYQVFNPYHTSQGGPTGLMNFGGYNPVTGIATWQSTANMTWSTLFGLQSISTKLELQFQPYTGVQTGPLGSGWLVPSPAASFGITTLNPATAVLDVDSLPNPDNFQVWLRFETVSGASLLSYYDGSSSLGGAVDSTAIGGFYYVVPEPGSAALIGLGVAALAVRRRIAR